MTNIEEEIDSVGQISSEKKNKKYIYFSNGYGQLPLSAGTSVQYNFSLIGGSFTASDCFKTGFYGLTKVTAEFQRAIDCILSELPQAPK